MVAATTLPGTPADESGLTTAPSSAATADLARGQALSRMRRRRLEMIPLRGPGAPYAAGQARQPGDSTTPAELSDLISSIAEIGVLHPILVEEHAGRTNDERPALRVVAGERRLRACRWGAVHLPDNENFNAIPAIISPGPVPPEECRKWQLVENLAREPLRPGEQAAALLLHRCAILTGKLLRAGRPVPADVYDIDDPVERFTTLEKIRASDPACAAPWAEVLARLGLQLTPRKARQIVRAFAELPRELSADMDEHQVALHTRIRFAQLRQGRERGAEDIWVAVKDKNRPDLLPAAVQATLDNPGIQPDDAVEAADALHQAANTARAVKLARHPAGPAATSEIDPASVRKAIGALRDLTAGLRAGKTLGPFDEGSLRLLTAELTTLLPGQERDQK
jgi:ParB family transcriptional regulator, chromosome partitioning protein